MSDAYEKTRKENKGRGIAREIRLRIGLADGDDLITHGRRLVDGYQILGRKLAGRCLFVSFGRTPGSRVYLNEVIGIVTGIVHDRHGALYCMIDVIETARDEHETFLAMVDLKFPVELDPVVIGSPRTSDGKVVVEEVELLHLLVKPTRDAGANVWNTWSREFGGELR